MTSIYIEQCGDNDDLRRQNIDKVIIRKNELLLTELQAVIRDMPGADLRPILNDYHKTIENLLLTKECTKETSKCDQSLNTCDRVKEDEFNKTGLKRTSSKTHISWDEYFMAVAQLASRRSKDPSTQVGACIVNEQNKIVATGYNGMPNGVSDDLVPWSKEGPYLDTKYAYVVHAELNAILNSVLTDQTNCRVYVSLFPCNDCAKAIIQSGIKHVIYLSDKHADKDATKAAKIMFKLAGVLCEPYSRRVPKIIGAQTSPELIVRD